VTTFVQRLFLTVLLLALSGVDAARAAGDCSSLITTFERAVASKSIDAAKRAVGEIASDILCGARAEEYQSRYTEFLIAVAGDAATGTEERRRALAAAEDAIAVAGAWRAAAALGDAYFRLGERSKAFTWYEKALSFMTSRPATRASASEKQALLAKAGAAKSGANEQAPEGQWLQSTRELDGRMGGMYAPGLLREVEVLSVPLPVRFFTDETRFTPEGEAAVAELAQAVKEQQLTRLRLIGHADPRGSDQHNLDLSRRRVEAVRAELMRRGVKARIDIDWKGSRQPFDASVLPYAPNQEDRWALDRRVEWMREAGAE
jgi:outer membrane protein OmpA-like peptidoglycan-associated protein